MYRVTVAYPAKQGGTFDFDYYRDKHMPMVRRHLGDNAVSSEISKGIAGAGTAAAPFTCIGQVCFTSLERFHATLAQHGAEIMGDIPNYTNIAPTVQIEELVE